jgi:sugar lactone lactonase YvrE
MRFTPSTRMVHRRSEARARVRLRRRVQARLGRPRPSVERDRQQPDAVHFSTDGLVYICERGSDRVQVFTKQGKYVTSYFVHPSTPARGPECGGPGSLTFGMCGTIYNLTFSHDADHRLPRQDPIELRVN